MILAKNIYLSNKKIEIFKKAFVIKSFDKSQKLL